MEDIIIEIMQEAIINIIMTEEEVGVEAGTDIEVEVEAEAEIIIIIIDMINFYFYVT